MEGVLKWASPLVNVQMFMGALTVPCFMNLHNPQGHDLWSLTLANGNSKLDATLQRQRGFTHLLTLCWKVTAKRSRVQSSLLSCLRWPHPHHLWPPPTSSGHTLPPLATPLPPLATPRLLWPHPCCWTTSSYSHSSPEGLEEDGSGER